MSLLRLLAFSKVPSLNLAACYALYLHCQIKRRRPVPSLKPVYIPARNSKSLPKCRLGDRFRFMAFPPECECVFVFHVSIVAT